jgi:cytochrome c-type biogenesis protein CcmH/NrfG
MRGLGAGALSRSGTARAEPSPGLRNLGIVLAAQGKDDAAHHAYDDAVRISPSRTRRSSGAAASRSRGDRRSDRRLHGLARNSSAPFRGAALTSR